MEAVEPEVHFHRCKWIKWTTQTTGGQTFIISLSLLTSFFVRRCISNLPQLSSECWQWLTHSMRWISFCQQHTECTSESKVSLINWLYIWVNPYKIKPSTQIALSFFRPLSFSLLRKSLRVSFLPSLLLPSLSLLFVLFCSLGVHLARRQAQEKRCLPVITLVSCVVSFLVSPLPLFRARGSSFAARQLKSLLILYYCYDHYHYHCRCNQCKLFS